MKKKFCSMCLVGALIAALFSGCGSSSTESGSASTKEQMTTVRLNEVAHSIFYAPLYVAICEGYFEEEGIDLEIQTGFGADKTMTALLSDEADIGLMGPETTVYTYNEGANDIIVNFAQLTQRAGNFIVAREATDSFEWTDLVGKNVLGGRAGGMPEMVFEYVLKKNGIDPQKDLTIDQSIDFGSTAAAFSGGQGDYTVEFEPSATALEQSGDGTVVASLGVDSGYVPYTAFSAKTSYLEENAETVQAFVRALKKGVDYVKNHSAEDVADAISPQFKETKKETIAAIVSRYADQDTWDETLEFEEEGYDLLLDILDESGTLTARPPYEILVTGEYLPE